MKSFKIKDLNISIGTADKAITPQLCQNPTLYCHFPSYQCPLHSYHCNIHSINCNQCSVFITKPCACTQIASIPDFTEWITTTPIQGGIEHLQENELAELKTNLATLQKAVDVKLQRSPEDLNELEAKLSEALAEVKAQKANRK